MESSDLSNTYGLDFRFYKRPSSEYNSNPQKKQSLKICPYSQSEEFKDGMSSDAIEGQLSHIENHIHCPIMLTADINSRHIYKPSLDIEYSSYTRPSQPHDDPRNPLR